jgi:uroporphyrinogen-III synthase
MPEATLGGLRVLSLESRRATEVGKLIRTYGGEPLTAPAMREVPIETNEAIFDFAEALLRGAYDMVVFTTGVGVRALVKAVTERYDREEFLAALRRVRVAARGPKSSSALREFGIPITFVAPEPFTWRALLTSIEAKLGDALTGMNITVQEYGASNTELLTALTDRNVSITRLIVYRWELPENVQPLREAVLALAHGHVDIVLFMNVGQVAHLFMIAERMGYVEALHEGLRSTVIASIGPSTTEGLSLYNLVPDYEPSQSKMGFMVNELAIHGRKLLAEKRAQTSAHLVESPDVPISPFLTNTSQPADANSSPSAVDLLHEIGSRVASSDSLHTVLNRIVDIACSVIRCDSCFVYLLEEDRLVLRASKNPHSDLVDRLGIWLGQGITGWVGWHREPVAIASNALKDPRFKRFPSLQEDSFEAFLSVPILSKGKLVGVINLQHRNPYHHTEDEVRLMAAIGFLVGAELERARLETENNELSERLESRKQVERAKGILQRDLGLDEEAAYRAMQRESRQRRKTMREIAEAILLNDDLRRNRLAPTARQEVIEKPAHKDV